jgi:hypothetical protein
MGHKFKSMAGVGPFNHIPSWQTRDAACVVRHSSQSNPGAPVNEKLLDHLVVR